MTTGMNKHGWIVPSQLDSAGYVVRTLAALLSIGLFCLPSQGQSNSGAQTITLRAVLQQSLTMSVSPADLPSVANGFDAPNETGSSLEVSTKWVRGPATVSVGVFAPANPILGVAGRALVPVEVAARTADAVSPASGACVVTCSNENRLLEPREIRINTGDLEIPEGSGTGVLTIRAQAL